MVKRYRNKKRRTRKKVIRGGSNSTLVLYVFHEYNCRVKHFIEHALFKSPNVTFLFVWNTTKNKDVHFEIPEYVTVLKRENMGYDFGAWSYGLFHEDNYKKYDNFVFVNSSVYGPFLKEGELREMWVKKYLDGLNDTVKLFGSTINTIKNTKKLIHVQSYIYCMKKETVKFLVDKELFSLTNISKTFDEAINKEIGMSRLIIDNGWNIGCLHKHYEGEDFKNVTDAKWIRYMDDIMYPEYIHSQPQSIYQELVFVKGNRLSMPC
jgi:hypothetical protein